MNCFLVRSALLFTSMAFFAAPNLAHAQATPGATFDVLYTFGLSNPNIINPDSALTQGLDGDFYGVSGGDGVSIPEYIYKMTSTGAVTLLSTSSVAWGNLTLGKDGNFYVVTYSAESGGDYTLSRMTPLGALTVLYTFPASQGTEAIPEYGVAIGPDGNFYGSIDVNTDYHNGRADSLFKLTPAGQYTVLYTCPDNEAISALPIFDSQGNVYATVGQEGIIPGSIVEVDAAGSVKTLYQCLPVSMDDPPEDPVAGLTLGSGGNLYGLMFFGGTYNDGLAFMLTPSGTFNTLYSFPANTYLSYRSFASPNDAMILGTDGNLYGTTVYGGLYSQGNVFQLTPSGEFTTLHDFSPVDSSYHNADGGIPSPLIEGKDGALYGVTAYGGTGGNTGEGTAFKITVPSLTASVSSTAPTPASAATRFDFNKDGHADLLWYNTVSGSVSRWLMNDQTALQYGSAFSQVAASSGWMPVAAPQTTDDGYPDLLWWNSLSGEMSVWSLQDQSVTQYGADFSQIANTNWKPVAVADNDAQGNWTLVFEDAKSGDICRWLMKGTTVSQYGGTIASLGAKTPWQVVGAPDLNSDGKSDLLLWNSETGEVTYWAMDLANSKLLAEHGDIAQIPDTSWHLVSSEDTNGDGHPDLIWWNAKTGEVSRWLMNGTEIIGYGAATTQVSDTTWQPTAIR